MTTTGSQDTMRSNMDLLGRDDVNDHLAIYSIIGKEEPGGVHTVQDECAAEFTWDYHKGARPALEKLYEKAKGAQWNGRTDLPWETEVDQEAIARFMYEQGAKGPIATADPTGTALEKWGDKEWVELNVEWQNWMLSQFLHGEQGALLCTAKIVETVPWIDAKYYASTQVVDEARHVEVFSRYLQEKCTRTYPVNAHLGMLLDDIIADSRWDMTYLGMQIMVEGLALASFSFMHAMTPDPLLKKLLRYVMADEARHVAFGVLSLQEIYAEMNAAEIRERQEFAYEAAVRMRDRLAGQEVWAHVGVSPADMVRLSQQDPQRTEFQSVLFSKIVPNCRKLGLLDAADGWLRTKFTEMGVIAYENFEDTVLELDQAADGSPVDRSDLDA